MRKIVQESIFIMALAAFVGKGMFFITAFSDEGTKVKVFDKPGERASCPNGFRELGRFAEKGKGPNAAVRGGLECQQDRNAMRRPVPSRPLMPKGGQENLPNELTIEEKDGKPAKCPDGYQQTGSFNNMTFMNGKLDKKSGISCVRASGEAERPGGNRPGAMPLPQDAL